MLCINDMYWSLQFIKTILVKLQAYCSKGFLISILEIALLIVINIQNVCKLFFVNTNIMNWNELDEGLCHTYAINA